MSTTDLPSWTRTANRLDRPKVDVWYKPEEKMDLEGILLWKGETTSANFPEPSFLYVVRDALGLNVGLTEKAALKGLRSAGIGGRVFVRPTGKKDIGDGRSMWEFEVFAETLDRHSASEPDGSEGIPI